MTPPTRSTQLIHFGRIDSRDCGKDGVGRRWTTEPNDVTCPACKDRDRFQLSAEATAYVASLEAR